MSIRGRGPTWSAVVIASAALGLVGISMLIRGRKPNRRETTRFQDTGSKVTPLEVKAVTNAVSSDKGAALGKSTSGKSAIPSGWRRLMSAALASGDPLKWEPLIADLLNPKYAREAAVAELKQLLGYPMWDVRSRAAQALLELGDYEGVPVLRNVLKAASDDKEVSWAAVVTAASTLQQYRQAIDSHDLYAAYIRFKAPELLVIGAMQQVPEMREIIAQKRVEGGFYYQTAWLAACMGMDDPDSMTQYRRLINGSLQDRLLGHWALYKTTSDANQLDDVIAIVRDSVGLNARVEPSWRLNDVKATAIELISNTITPKATRTLEEVADYAARSGDTTTFSSSFGALFYLHRDYAFVDQRLFDLFQSRYAGPGVAVGLMLQVAAARNRPELETAAKAYSPAAFEYAFHAMKGRPVESWWKNLGHVPITVAGPLNGGEGAK